MKRIKLIIGYDGTNYCGWQRQPNGITIESVITQALLELTKGKVELIGASRTDAGVHAIGNTAVFDTEFQMPPEKYSYALNVRLPNDIIVQKSSEVSKDFHPRYHAKSKTYDYKIWNAAFPMPINNRYTHFIYRYLDVAAMREAASYFVGTHDFKSFCTVGAQVKETIRTVYSLDILTENTGICIKDRTDFNEVLITIRITGNGFLYNMVRIITGTLIQVGLHTLFPEQILDILDKKNRNFAGPTAAAKGLTLIQIEY